MNVIERVKQILNPQKEYPDFHGTNWKPMDQMVIKDLDLKAKIENDGYAVVSILDQSLIESLAGIYNNHHSKETENGGMFYSLYSQDINYRKKVNDELEAQLKSTYESLFVDYKTVINSFIIKYPGPKSEFYLHQDSTGLNEWKHSPVSVWMPLQETTVDNGCMWVVPGSHKWFSPYRGIAFPSMFEAHQDMLRPYLKPITVNLGEVLLFDNRIVHLSGANLGTHPRVIVMSGIFPKQAELIACYRDAANQGPLEVFVQDEDFLLKNLNFYIDCTARPKLGSKIAECKKVKYDYSESELKSLLDKHAGEKNDQYQYDLSNVSCDIIEEPV